MFTINRSLCEMDFSIELENIDVDVMEFIFFKIRENRNHPSEYITIGFSEMKKGIGRYKKDSYISSIKRLDGVSITTNQKSENISKRYKFSFTINSDNKSFKVGLDEKIFRLFDKPKLFNSYHQNYLYNLNTKHQKLLYKFFVGYKFLIGKDIFVKSDMLKKILNIHNDKPLSEIQSDIFQYSQNVINQKTDLNISMKKECIEYKNNTEIVKYRVTINSYKDDEMKGNDLKNGKSNKKSDVEKRLDSWIKNLKSEICDIDISSKQIPMVVLKNSITNLPIYIDNEYRLRDIFTVFTNTPSKTMDTINKWIENDEFTYDVMMMDGYSKPFEKVCLLSEEELKRRGMI
jgi:hypothetical protein